MGCDMMDPTTYSSFIKSNESEEKKRIHNHTHDTITHETNNDQLHVITLYCQYDKRTTSTIITGAEVTKRYRPQKCVAHTHSHMAYYWPFDGSELTLHRTIVTEPLVTSLSRSLAVCDVNGGDDNILGCVVSALSGKAKYQPSADHSTIRPFGEGVWCVRNNRAKPSKHTARTVGRRTLSGP